MTTNPFNLYISTLEQAYSEVKRKEEVEILRLTEEIESLEVDKLYSKKKRELQGKLQEHIDKEKKLRKEIFRKDQANQFY